MSIIDRIAATEADIAEYRALDASVADLQAQILTANLQHQNDQQTIAQLQATLAVDIDAMDAMQGQITDLRAQLAAFPNLQLIDGYELNPVSLDLANRSFAVWSPRVGPGIGGVAPSTYSAKWLNGQLVLSATGIAGKWCDVLWVNKRPPLPPGVKTFALDFGLTVDGSASTQCIEVDTLVLDGGMEYNLSSQRVQSSGKLQIANGATKGGWLDAGPVFDLAPNVRHACRWIYGIDRANKTCQYIAFILDGKRYDIDPTVGKQPAYPQAWGDQLALQLQQDVNSQGGTVVTVFDSIRYLYVGN